MTRWSFEILLTSSLTTNYDQKISHPIDQMAKVYLYLRPESPPDRCQSGREPAPVILSKVPEAGIEPAHLTVHDFESCASTSSATQAFKKAELYLFPDLSATTANKWAANMTKV